MFFSTTLFYHYKYERNKRNIITRTSKKNSDHNPCIHTTSTTDKLPKSITNTRTNIVYSGKKFLLHICKYSQSEYISQLNAIKEREVEFIQHNKSRWTQYITWKDRLERRRNEWVIQCLTNAVLERTRTICFWKIANFSSCGPTAQSVGDA